MSASHSLAEQQAIIEQLRSTLEQLTVQNKQAQQTQYPQGDNGLTAKDLLDYSKSYIDFTYENPTVYHTVEYFASLLEKAGFTYLDEKKDWNSLLSTNSTKYYTTRNDTSLCAFNLGQGWSASQGIGAIDCHVDALTAKLKPFSTKESVEGYCLLGVAPYGGTLNEVWFDRDLGIGGRVLYRDEATNSFKSVLINSAPHPIARIPTLAPHFGEPAIGPFDKEDQAVPVVGFSSEEDHESCKPTADEKKSSLFGKHSIHLLRYVAKLANVEVSQLVQLDLDLFDVQKGSIGGLKDDFLFAPRLDDRLCSFAAVTSLIEHSMNIKNSSNLDIVTLYDNEEVGSLSRQGAKGGLMEATVERILESKLAPSTHARDCSNGEMYAKSIVLSADVNHLFNPNFKEVYMKNHSPKPNIGVTLSLDPNAHMATDVVGVALVEELARLNDDKIQYFQIKNNSRSGGTIGPSISSQTGARTIDLGIAQLSMHSIRATTGSRDIGLGVKFFKGFFKNWKPTYEQFGSL